MSEKKDTKIGKRKINKVIYFDDSSVTDYVQIIAGGRLDKTTELLSEVSKAADGGASAKASAGIGKVFKALIGFEAGVEANASLKIGKKSNELVRNILQNTILTDFLEIADASQCTSSIQLFESYKIGIIEDSLSYIIMVSPFMNMLKDNDINIENSQYAVSIEKIDETLRLAKGYFEFTGTPPKGKEGKSVILRFNIDAFKNNYKISDLVKMDLRIYALRVGKTSLEKLKIQNEIVGNTNSSPETKIADNPSFESENQEQPSNEKNNNDMDIYDVLLAGVVE